MKKQTPVFDKYVSDYRGIHTQNIHNVSGVDSAYFCEFKLKLLEQDGIIPQKSGKWLDFGCGDGSSAEYITKHYPEYEYIGLDISTVSLDVARQRYGERYQFVSYDGVNMPFEDNSFDVIYLACVLHHIEPEDRPHIIKELIRILKPGGNIVIFEHNPYNPLTRKVVHDCIFDEGVKLVRPGRLIKLLKKNDIKTDLYYSIFFPRKKLFAGMLKYERRLSKCPLGGQYYMYAGK